MRRVLTTVAILAGAATTASAQTIWVAPAAALASYQERGEQVQYDGFGFGGMGGFNFGRLSIEAEGYIATMKPDDETTLTDDVKFKQMDVRVGFDIVSAVTVQAGLSGRQADPEFSVPDVGFIRIGLKSEQAIARIARVWVRGAYLIPKFNTGGDAGFAFELGLGTYIGAASGRFGAIVQYDFTRIDRTVNAVDLPLQLMVAKFGLQLGL
jgi:hypothetical protein